MRDGNELLTAGEMKTLEEAAIAAGEVAGIELMERAGAGLVEQVFAWRPDLAAAPHAAAIFCGPGNNGGDGFVMARLLAERGWRVEARRLGTGEGPPDAARNRRRWEKMGETRPLEAPLTRAPDLVVDAVFGGGLTRPVSAAVAAAVAGPEPGARRDVTFAVDAPSGLCLDSGRALGPVAPAAATATFQRLRRGHHLAEGPALCGRVGVIDIGLERRFAPDRLRATLGHAPLSLYGPPAASALAKGGGAHKYDHGHAVVLAGGVGKGGAARLAARAALRVGAGLVTVAAPPAALIENAARLDAVMLRRVEGAEGLAALLRDRRLNAVVMGPGMGVGPETRAGAAAALAAAPAGGVVLDADALTSFAEDPAALFALTRGAAAVLTPHAGEFARLFPDAAARLKAPASAGPAFSRVDAAQAAAEAAGCVVLLKGPDTVIAGPGGAATLVSANHARACPWLATAGAGDVLSGLIGGLMARGLSPFEAAAAGAWLHQEAARAFGPGLIAEDIPETLPRVFRGLGL